MWTLASFYKFVALPQPTTLRAHLLPYCQQHGLVGTILLAEEGINATVAGSPLALEQLLAELQPHTGPLLPQWATVATAPFQRLKVKVKREIVTLGCPEANPTQQVGTYVPPAQWNQVLRDPETLVIDTRNQFEVDLGTFAGAVTPRTTSFRQFPAYVESHLQNQHQRPVALFCTGGIRCEKATSLLRHQGFERVYHLQGGILSYLRQVKPADSLWQGDCFVFDERVSVDHHLHPGDHQLCQGCGYPLSPAERESPLFVPGISCPHCHDQLTPAKRERLQRRQNAQQTGT